MVEASGEHGGDSLDLLRGAEKNIHILKDGDTDKRLEASEQFKRDIEAVFLPFAPSKVGEKFLSLTYQDSDLLVFPEFVQEFLTFHIENQGKLNGYVKQTEHSLSFGLRDRDNQTDLSMVVNSDWSFYHNIGFWGSSPNSRYRWRHMRRPEIETVSQLRFSDSVQFLSEEEATLILTTAKFILSHHNPSSN